MFKSDKRKKELARLKKQEEKRQRRFQKDSGHGVSESHEGNEGNEGNGEAVPSSEAETKA